MHCCDTNDLSHSDIFFTYFGKCGEICKKNKDVPLKLNRADVRVKCDVLENQVLNVMICLCWIFLVSSISFVQIVFLVFIFSNEHFCLSNSFFKVVFLHRTSVLKGIIFNILGDPIVLSHAEFLFSNTFSKISQFFLVIIVI